MRSPGPGRSASARLGILGSVTTEQRGDALVLFGVSGDLVRKKLIPALYELSRVGRLGIPVLGVARSDWDDDRLHAHARASVESTTSGDVDQDALRGLVQELSMVVGDYGDPATYQHLAQRLEGAERPVFYLAIPPAVFPQVVQGLADVGLAKRGRVIVE